MGEKEQIPAGIGKMYFTTADDKNLEHLQEVELKNCTLNLNDADTEGESHWADNNDKGWTFTGTATLAPNKSTELMRKILHGSGRLPRKEKKRRRNRIMRNKKILIRLLTCTMIDRGTAFNEAAVVMFGEKKRVNDEHMSYLLLNKAEWHAVDTFIAGIYKRRLRMLKREWQRNRLLFPGVKV